MELREVVSYSLDPTVPVTSPVSITPTGGIRLHASRPHPSSGVTIIRYEVARALPVSLQIYDVAGRLIAGHRDSPPAAGVYTWRWDGTDRRGNPVAPGIYFYRLEAGGREYTRRLAIIR